MKWWMITGTLITSFVIFQGCQKKCEPGKDAECWMELLKDEEQAKLAISNLRQLNDKKAEAALVQAFENFANQPENRENIAEIFGKWKSQNAVKPMIAALDFTVGKNQESRKSMWINRANQKIATALGNIGSPEAISPLLKLLKASREGNVQRAAIRALGELKAKEAVNDLIALTEDSGANIFLRRYAAYALGEIGDPKAIDALIMALYRDKAAMFYQANLSLVRIGEPAIDPLIQTMMGKNQNAKQITEADAEVLPGALEANAAKVLGDIGSEKGLDALLNLAGTVAKWEEEANRLLVMSRIINGLGVIGSPKGLKIVMENMKEELWDLRTVCADAVNYIGDRSTITEMLKIVNTGQHPETRAPLIEAIGNLGTDEVLPQVKELTNTQKDVTIQQSITGTIKRLEAYAECKQDLACWIKKLSHSDPTVREKAAYELGRLADPKALDPLIQIIGDPEIKVRFAVMWAFDKLKSKKPIPALEELLAKEKDSARYNIANHNYELVIARLSREGKP